MDGRPGPEPSFRVTPLHRVWPGRSLKAAAVSAGTAAVSSEEAAVGIDWLTDGDSLNGLWRYGVEMSFVVAQLLRICRKVKSSLVNVH